MIENKNNSNQGISLKTMNYTMSIITIIISIVLLISTLMTQSSYKKTVESTYNYIDWEQTAERLQAGSDYLTDQVRTFVVTGNVKHMNNYFEEANVTQRRDKALALLEENLKGNAAYKYLEESMKESLELMNIEYYAMNLAARAYGYDFSTLPIEVASYIVEDGDLVLSKEDQIKKAMELVFDDTYHDYKERIYNGVNKSIVELGALTEKNLNDAFAKLQRLLIIQQVLIVVIVIVVITLIILTLIQVVNPLIKAIPQIKNEKMLPIEGAYEYRYLAKTYNKMYKASKQHEKFLAYEATHDALTDALNINGFNEIIKGFNFENSALIVVDVDDFKNVNDSSGHLVGDDVLKLLATYLKNYFRRSDVICRMGGDEFVVIVTNINDTKEQRESICDKIKRINEQLSNQQPDIPLCSVSAGVAFGEEGILTEEIIKRADKALYYVKENGKHDCAFYSENM